MCICVKYLAFVFTKVLNSSVDTRCKHPTYPLEIRSSNVHRVGLCIMAVREVTLVLVLQMDKQKQFKYIDVKCQVIN